MSTLTAEGKLAVGIRSAGILLSPEEFDLIEAFDDRYRYELIHGVLVVNPIPLPEERGPNEFLGHLLLTYRRDHPQGSILADTLPQEYVRTKTGRRIADRLIWTGLGRLADPRRDRAAIAVEFVSSGRRNRRRDYLDKREEYMEVGISEYWIFDRFQRTLTVFRNRPGETPLELVIAEGDSYESPLLPGFEVPLAAILHAADLRARQD